MGRPKKGVEFVPKRQIAIRMEKEKYIELAIMLAEKDIKLQEYIIGLVDKDMKREQKKKERLNNAK